MRALFPDITEAVDAAYASFAGEPQQAGFDEWLDQQVDEVLPGPASLTIQDSEAAARFDAAFVAAKTAAGLLHATVPEIEAFAEAGVDLDRLAAAMSADATLTPVPAPHGLGANKWIEAFDSLDSPKLVIAEDAAREFASLDLAPAPSSRVVKVGRGAGPAVQWTLRLIPSAPGPSLLGLSFAHGPHVTLSEMLMLQLMRHSVGEPPLDATSFTWLAGSLAQGRLAARHVYDATERAIRITCREVVSQGPHLGARPAGRLIGNLGPV